MARPVRCVQRTITEGSIYWVTCWYRGPSDVVTCAYTWDGELVQCVEGLY